VFQALLVRDVIVARREIASFLVRTALQPVLFVVVFGYLLPKMGFVQRGYNAAMLPGVLAVGIAFASMQSVVLPMMTDFGWSKEIEDRLLAPVPIRLVALEKVVSGVLHGLVAVVVVLPIARLIMGPIPGLSAMHVGEALLMTVLGASAFSMFGLLLGTAITPQQVSIMFSVILAPMIFFGCAYYPWRGLDRVPVMKYAVLVNPLVYVAEGMRATLTPTLPHMSPWIAGAALLLITAIFWLTGIRSFEKRALS